MRVKKRSGALEPVDVNKIVNSIARASEGLLGVDPMRVATRTISALADGASTRELDDLSIRTAAGRGWIDLYVLEPGEMPDEVFHRTVSELLQERARLRGSGPAGAVVKGPARSRRVRVHAGSSVSRARRIAAWISSSRVLTPNSACTYLPV